MGRILRGASWTFLGIAISRALVLLGSIVLARMLGTARFGELGYLLSTLTTFQMVASLGMGLTATKFIGEYRSKDKEAAGNVVGLAYAFSFASGVVATAILYLVSSKISAKFVAGTLSTTSIQLVSVLVLFGAVNACQIGILSGFEQFRLIALTTVWAGISNLTCQLVGGWLARVEGVEWGMVGAQFSTIAICGVLIQRCCKSSGINWSFRGALSQWKILVEFALPAALGSIVVPFATWVVNSWLLESKNGLTEMAVLNASLNWRTAILYLPSALGSSSVPILSALYSRDAHASYMKVAHDNLKISTVLASSFAVGVYFFSRLITKSYGEGFENTQWPLVIVCISAVLSAAIGCYGYVMACWGGMWAGFTLNLIWAVAFVVLANQLIHKGALGIAVSYLGAYVLHLVTVSIYVYALVPVRMRSAQMDEA